MPKQTMKILTALFASLLVGSVALSFSRPRGALQPAEQLVNRLPSQTPAAKASLQPLPEPTGPYRVGTSILHQTDTSRPDPLAGKAGQFRELMFQLWYPTDKSQGEIAPYIPNPGLVPALKAEGHDGQDPALFDAWRDIRTGAIMDAPVSRKRSRFPLLFFSHGLGEPRSLYAAFSQDLASRGYIVVTIDHPYGGITILPDGRILSPAADPDAGGDEWTVRQVEAWAKDASFVLEVMSSPARSGLAVSRFSGKIDPARIGMLGHSLGGAAALEACRTDSRFKACADLDGAPFGKVKDEGMKRPTLIMRSGPIYSDQDLAKRGRTRAQWEEMGRQGREMWGSLFQRSKNAPVYSVKINGAGHMSYSDSPFVMPDTINRFGGRIIEAHRGFEIMARYVSDFFRKYFYGKHSELLDSRKSPYPEVTAERFIP